MKNIVFIGSGAIATALGNVLASLNGDAVYLLSIEEEVIESINKKHVNIKYFPNVKLSHSLEAGADKTKLSSADIIFLAIPSSKTICYLKDNQKLFSKSAIIVNLAKGFGNDNKTIVESMLEMFPDNPVASLKGPSFARDIINKLQTGLTVGTKNIAAFEELKNIFNDSHIYLDHSDDIIGVDLLSILKNIYAIAIGIIDAHYNSPNLRFMVLTNAFKEMRSLLLQFGGKEETLYKYCGIGDFGLTALNDLSRNRTLGLLIGKGFFSKDISDNVLLEGKIAVNVFCEEISKQNSLTNYHIINELYKVFNNNYDSSKFLNNILKK